MFKELMPQNADLGMVLDTILISLGGLGGIAGLITYRWKTKYQAKIQAEMQAKADELSQTLSEKITRRGKAFDLRIKKEYEFYEKYGTYTNRIVNSMRDVKDVFVSISKNIPVGEGGYEKVIVSLRDTIFASELLLNEYLHYIDSDMGAMLGQLLNEMRDFIKSIMAMSSHIKDSTPDEVENQVLNLADNTVKCITIIHKMIKAKLDLVNSD